MVWNPNENDLKILKFLNDFREGARAKSLRKYCGFKTSTLYKRLNVLKIKGLVLDEFPMWKLVNGQVKFVESLLKSDKKIFELHSPGYVIRLIEMPKWWNPKGNQMRNKLMMIRGYQFQQVRDFGKNSSNPYIQIKNDKFVIQMYPEAITIIHRKRYYSDNPHDLTIQFMNDFYDLWVWFEEKMKFKFFKEGIPQMTLRGHDYNRINDWMSKYVVKKVKHRVLVEIGDGRRVWYDLSDPKGRETNTAELQIIMEKDILDKVLNKPMLNSELQTLITETTTELNSLSKLIVKKESVNNEEFKDLSTRMNRLAQAQDKMFELVLKNSALINKLIKDKYGE